MNPYMFVIDAVPNPENDKCADIAGAKVHIWVIDNDLETAKIRSFDYIKKYLWQIKSVEYEFLISPEQIDNLHKGEARLYQKALNFGIAADFLAYPKKEGNPGDPVEIRRL